jgi:hypothetical protein
VLSRLLVIAPFPFLAKVIGVQRRRVSWLPNFGFWISDFGLQRTIRNPKSEMQNRIQLRDSAGLLPASPIAALASVLWATSVAQIKIVRCW